MKLQREWTPDFNSKYRGKKRKLFNYEGEDLSSTFRDTEYFRVYNSLKIIGNASVFLKSRFKLYANHQNIFLFLYMKMTLEIYMMNIY